MCEGTNCTKIKGGVCKQGLRAGNLASKLNRRIQQQYSIKLPLKVNSWAHYVVYELFEG